MLRSRLQMRGVNIWNQKTGSWVIKLSICVFDGMSLSESISYLFADVKLGEVLCVYFWPSKERHQVPRGKEPQEAQRYPDKNCLFHTYWDVWVWSLQIWSILKGTYTHTQTHMHHKILLANLINLPPILNHRHRLRLSQIKTFNV